MITKLDRYPFCVLRAAQRPTNVKPSIEQLEIQNPLKTTNA